MEILLWLVPAGVATLIAMGIAGWVGRERPAEHSQVAERLPGEIVGRPGEGVSAPRPARQPAADRPPAPARDADVRRTA